MINHIQINDVSPRIQYLADGVQSAFTFPFAIFADSDLEAWIDEARQSGGYSISGAGISTGGTALFAVPPAAGSRVTLRRRLPIRRITDYQADGLIRAKTLNDEMDYQVATLQQVAEDSERTVRRSATSSSSADLTLPEPAAGKAIGWNAAGTGLTNDPGDFTATVTIVSAQAGIAASKAIEAVDSATDAHDSAANAANAAATAQASAFQAEQFNDLARSHAAAAAAQAAAAHVAKVEWKGAWNNTTAYEANDAVSHGGGSWICVTAHTEQIPKHGPYWDVLAAKGLDGFGAGDMLASNNLSDVTDPAMARANLGLGSAATTDLPGPTGHGGHYLRQKPTMDGLEYRAPAQVLTDLGGLSATAAAEISAQLDHLKTNLALTVIRLIANAGSSYMGMVDGWADEFEDTLGIGSLGTATYDAVGDCVHNRMADSVVPLTGTNVIQASGITWYSDQATGKTCMVDGNTATLGFHTDNAGIGSVVVFDMMTPKECKQLRLHIVNATTATWNIQYSDNNSTWTTVFTGLSASGGTGWKTAAWGLAGAHRYWRLYKSDTAVTGNWHSEVEWTAAGPVTDITVSSVTMMSQTSPSQGRVTLVVTPQVPATYGTDNRIRMSRDGGTTWVTGTMAVEASNLAFPGGQSVDVVTAEFDFTGTPSGTAMRVEWSTFNNKHQLLHAWYPEWKA